MLIVGVSGVTNGGKTTLAEALHAAFPKSYLLCQDTYFLPVEDSRHILLPQLGHFNWEIMSSIDMDKMWEDIEHIIHKPDLSEENSCCNSSLSVQNDLQLDVLDQSGQCAKNITDTNLASNITILIIEGLLILNYKPIADICHLKYHLTLDKEECCNRRSRRDYEPPDVPGYFDLCVWPEYVKHRDEMLQTVKDVKVINGCREANSIFDEVMGDISEKIQCQKSALSN